MKPFDPQPLSITLIAAILVLYLMVLFLAWMSARRANVRVDASRHSLTSTAGGRMFPRRAAWTDFVKPPEQR
jgi:hypothetical protein